jgi:hypothetical protein
MKGAFSDDIIRFTGSTRSHRLRGRAADKLLAVSSSEGDIIVG